MTDLFTRPRFHRDVHFHKHTDRAVGWLELFYDLVYVATFIQIGNFLSDNLTFTGFGQFSVLMFVLWWAWTGETFYQNRYFVDDIPHRILVLVQMFGIAAMGLSVSGAFGDLAVQFALSFALVRFMLVLMFVRVWQAHEGSRLVSAGYMVGFAIGIAIWIASAFLPDDVRFVAWLVAIVFEIIYFGRRPMMRALIEWGPDDHHLVERFGIFTIIVLGEAFVKVLDDAQGTSLGVDQVVLGMLLVTILFGLWWLHFSDTADEVYDLDSDVKPMLWSYGHLFLASSLVMFGVAAKKVFSQVIKDADKALTDEYRVLLTAALVLFLVSQAMINGGLDDAHTVRNQNKRIVSYVITAVLIGIVGLAATSLSPIPFTLIVAFLTIGLVVADVVEMKRGSERHHAHI